LLARWTATVSKSVSHGADGKTIRQNWLELAETLPLLAFKSADGYGLFSCSDEQNIKTSAEPIKSEAMDSRPNILSVIAGI
jgi:hypothetical protein